MLHCVIANKSNNSRVIFSFKVFWTFNFSNCVLEAVRQLPVKAQIKNKNKNKKAGLDKLL